MQKIIFVILFLFLLPGCSINPTAGIPNSPTEIPTKTYLLPTVSGWHPSEQDAITTNNINQLELIARWGKGNIFDMDISPDGKTAAIASSIGFYLYDIPSITDRTPAGYPFKNEQQPGGVAFSPDGKYLAIASDQVIIWNLLEDRIETQFKNILVDFPLERIGFSRDSKQVFTRGMGGIAACDAWGGAFQLFDINEGKLLYHQYFCPESAIFFSRATSEGNIFFTGINPSVDRGSYDTAIVKSSTGKVIKSLKSSRSERIYDINSDGTLAAVRAYRNNQWYTDLLDIRTESVIKSVEGNIIFLPDSDHYLNQADNNFHGWMLKDSNGTALCEFKDGENELSLNIDVYQSNFKVKGNYLTIWDSWKEEIQFWDTSNCRLIQKILSFASEYPPRFSPDGKTLAMGSTYYIHLWDVATGQIRHSVPGSERVGPFYDFAFGPTEAQIVTVTRDTPKLLKFFDTETGKNLEIQKGDDEYLQAIAISPDGSKMALLDRPGLHLINLQQGNEYYTSAQFAAMDQLSFSPDGTKLAVFCKYSHIEFYIIDIETGVALVKVTRAGDRIAAISPDWKYFSTIDSLHHFKLWDLEEGVLVRDFAQQKSLPDQNSLMLDVDFSFNADGTIFTSLSKSQLQFWDVRTGALLREITTQFDLSYITYSPDGRLLVTTGSDGTVHVWGIK